MPTSIHIITIGKDKQKDQAVLAKLAKEIGKQYTLTHIAHCDSINTIKHVLTSLIITPRLLISGSSFFDEEQEEIREIANRVLPDMKLVMVPSDLDEGKGGVGEVLVEYLREQVESRF